MDELEISAQAIKDYCFDYDQATDKLDGLSIRCNNPKKLVSGIDLKELFEGKEVLFEVSQGYDEKILEEENPDVFNDIIYIDSKHLREKRGAPPLNCSFADLAKNMVNITENGYVRKQIITNGVGELVSENAYVTIHYNMYKENCELPFDSTYLRNKTEKIRLNQGETILGLYYAIKSMKKNENSRFFIKWEYAFGALGCPDRIEPKCDIIADLTLINFDVLIEIKNSGGLTEEEINKENFNKYISQAKKHHINGGDEFKRGETNRAICSYKKSLRILNDLRLANKEEEDIMLKLKVKGLVNLALSYNKLGKFEQACLACQDALAIDCNNVRACFHYGRATLGLSNFNMSQKWLTKAARLKPNDSDINDELKKLNEKKKLHEIMDKEFWEKAFKNINNAQE